MAEKKRFDLAAALGDVSKLDTGVEGREQIEYIDIDRLHQDERNFYELPGIRELAANIEFAGLQQPLRVRADLKKKGHYIIVSGHRRHAALSSLVKEGNEKFRQVACIVEKQSGATDEVEAWLQELRLIYGNSDTRRMSAADIAKQAERVEMLLYQLKEAGVEFPGKMRNHVAEACKVSASKLARLKVIREGLAECWKAHWDDGSLVEASAYELARYSPQLQMKAYEVLTDGGALSPKNIPAWRYEHLAYVDEFSKATCKKAGDAPCERLEAREISTIKDGRFARCSRCCAECWQLSTCKKVCSHCLDLAQKKAEAAAAEKAQEAQEAKEREAKEKEQQEIGRKAWVRLGNAITTANVPLDSLMELWVYRPDEDDVAEIKHRFAGEALDGDGITMTGDHPLQNLGVEELVDLADRLGVSLDFLFCRTDDPGMVTVATASVSAPDKPTWLTGCPKHDGRYYCRIQLENNSTMSLALLWNCYDGCWVHPADGQPAPYPVLGWWPLPEDPDEDD